MTNFNNKGEVKIIGIISMVLFVYLLASSDVSAQSQTSEIVTLPPDQTLEREMKGAETHRYKFDLKENEFFQVRIEQKGVDVALKLIDAHGKTLATMDSPNSKEGPETLSFAASTAGTYTLEVSGFDEKAKKGNYTIKRQTSRAATAQDRRRVEVEHLFVEGIMARSIQGQGEIAIQKLETALEGWKELKDDYLEKLTIQQVNSSKAKIAIDEATKLLQQPKAENYRAAREKFLTASRLYKDIGEKSGEAQTLVGAGVISNNLGEKRVALEYYKQALPLFQALSEKYWESVTLTAIGRFYEDLSENQKALDFYRQALPFLRDAGDKRAEAVTLTGIGRIYQILGEHQKALDFYNQSLPLARTVGDKSVEATTLGNIGWHYLEISEYHKALNYFNQSLTLLREAGDKRGEAITLSNIGRIYSVLNENKKALDFYNEALLIARNIGSKNVEAATLTNIGAIYHSLGEKQQALSNYNQSLLIFRSADDKSGEAATLSNIGEIYLESGDTQKGLDSLNQSLILHREIGNKNGEATTINNIGAFYFRLGEHQKALNFFNQALRLYRTFGGKNGEAGSLGNIMLVWKLLNNRTVSIFYGKQSVNVYQQLRSNIKGLDKSIQQTYLKSIETTYRILADIMIADSRLPGAQAVLDLLKDEEFSGLLRRSGNADMSVPYSKAETAALEVIERVAALGREKGELAEKNEKGSLTDAEKLRFREITKQIEITEAEFNKSLVVLSAEKNKGQNFDVVATDAQAFMDDLKNLGKGTVALYTVVVNDSKPTVENGKPAAGAKEQIKTGWIILVTPEFRKAYPIDVKNLEQTVFAFRTALSSPRYDPQPLARELYKKLFLQTSDKQKTTLASDLDEYFKGKPDKTLMWSLDGVLRYVPMAALHDGNGYLVEKYRNTIFNTASKGRLNAGVKPKWTVLGLGVSLGREESGKSFPALAGAKRELLTIVRQKDNPGIMSGSIKLDDQFTSDAMYDGLLFDKNPVVHIASHFSFQPADFDQSFLLLGKGKLTVKELLAKSTLFSNVDLLTLSACETAVGSANGKDVEGFAYVAQSLGAKAVMATLWQVDDIGTQVLMPEFYRLRESGIGKGEALRQAQLALLQGKIKDAPAELKRAEIIGGAENNQYKLTLYNKEGKSPFAHPFYWSPFVLIGNWR
jgi:CHAT domain-containing protein/tetratricopeptide (TPR) repeat protein